MRILVVEDDALLGDAIQVGLTQAGYVVDWVRDGTLASASLCNETYMALVLDLGLPRLSGMTVLAQLRSRGDSLPVIILTARDTVDDRIRGLDAGADDYLVKPFDMGELSARLRALVRRTGGYATPQLRYGELTVDPASHQVTYQHHTVELMAKEFALLYALLLNSGRVLSRAQLEDKLYSWGQEVESNAIEVYIHHLRRKLYPTLIATVRGVGYLIPKVGNDDHC